MRLKKALLVFLISTANLTYGQIKIGDNPQNINQSSVLELESTSRALVITRVNTSQMNAITPLQGAMVYNTSTQCIHYYNGSQWLNLCDALANSVNISLMDNGDGTYTFSDANNNLTEINNLNESLVVEDGSLILTDTSGNAISVELQNLSAQTFTTDATAPREFPSILITTDANGTNFNFEVGVIDGLSIQDGSIRQIDLAGASVGSVQLRDNSVGNLAIADNAVGSLEIINGSVQPIDLGPGNSNQILTTNGAGAVQWVDQTGLVSADEVTYNNAISNLTANNVQEALDEVTNNINTLTIGDILTQGNDAANQNIRNVTDPSLPQDAATKNYVDQAITAGTADGSETILNNGTNINITGTGTSGSPYVINNTFTEVDGSVTNEIQSLSQVLVVGNEANNSITNLTNPVAAQDAATKAYVDAQVGGSAQVIVSGNTPNSIIPGTDGGALYNDGDSDDSNELSDLVFNPGTSILTLSNSATPANSVDLSSLSGTGTDDQNLTGASLSGTILQIDIENGNSATVDLGTLSGVDTDDQTLSLSGNEISISEGNTIDLTPILGTGGTDDQQLVLAGNILTLEDGGTPIDLTPFLDDTDDQTITDFTFNNATNILTLTIDGGNTDTADLSALAGGGNPAASDVTFTPIGNTASNNVQLAIEELQTEIDGISGGGAANPNDELITSFNLSGTEINILEAGTNFPLDLNPVFATDTELEAAIVTSEALDNDTNATNELQTITSPDASVTVTSVGNNYELIVAGNTDNQNIQGSSLNTETLTIGIQNGTSEDVDLSSFALDNELAAAIAASEALDNDTNATNELQTITSPDASVTVTPVGNNYELTVAGSTDNQNIQGSSFAGNTLTIGIENGTSQDVNLSDLEESADITANATLINNHITADGDLSDTNELQTITSPDASVTVTSVGNNYELTVAGGSTDDQNLGTATLSGTDLTINIEDGNPTIADLAALATDTELGDAIAASEALDNDTNATNELQTITSPDASVTVTPVGNNYELTVAGSTDNQNIQGSSFAGNTLTIGIENGTSQDVNLSDLEESADITANATLINNHITADGDLSDTNELQTITSPDASVTVTSVGNNYELTVAGGSTDDQNLGTATLSGTDLTINIEDGNPTIADLAALATDTELGDAIAASEALDNDTNATNELQTITSPDASVTVTPVGNNYELTVAGSTDNQNIQGSSFAGNTLTIGIENGTSQDVNLSDLEESADITANATLINNHITADGDLSDTNELQTITSPDASVTVTSVGNNYELTVAGGSTDDQNLGTATLSGTDLTINIEDGNPTIADLAALATDTELGDAIAASEALDNDTNATNELQTITSPDASVTVTPVGNNYELSIASTIISGSQVDPDFGSQAISTTGTLGAGNTTITGDLTVSNSVTVGATQVHPDYVFQKYFMGYSILNDGYEFKNLEEIATFIKKNHHLPGIKSADEVQKDGFWNLSESNLQNLEKIEELFLHTIEQEKKIQELKSENEILSKELNSLKNDLEEIKALLKKD